MDLKTIQKHKKKYHMCLQSGEGMHAVCVEVYNWKGDWLHDSTVILPDMTNVLYYTSTKEKLFPTSDLWAEWLLNTVLPELETLYPELFKTSEDGGTI